MSELPTSQFLVCCSNTTKKTFYVSSKNWMIFFIIERDNFSPNIIALNEYKENRRSK